MWNPFKKSKLKQLKEVAAEATIKYIVDSYEADIKKRLLNKDVDITKLNKFLASNSGICITDMHDIDNFRGFINSYTYEIKKIDNDEYVIIDGKLIMFPDAWKETERYVTICIGEKHNNVVCYGTIGSVVNYNVQESIDISLLINVPIKEDTVIDKLI